MYLFVIHMNVTFQLNVTSIDYLYVDIIGRNHLHVDVTSMQVSGINNNNILQETFIVLLSHLNRLNNT